jgi:hypothetical protein
MVGEDHQSLMVGESSQYEKHTRLDANHVTALLCDPGLVPSLPWVLVFSLQNEEVSLSCPSLKCTQPWDCAKEKCKVTGQLYR